MTAHKISRAITIFASCHYPKEMEGLDFTLCVPKKPQVWEASAAGSQFRDLSAWYPSAKFAALSTGCSFSRGTARLGSYAGNIIV